MKALWVGLPYGLLALAVLGYGCEQRRAGRLEGQLSTLTRERDAFEKASKVIRTEFVRDTVILTKRVTEFRTLVDSIRTTDTLTVREQIIVAAADTAIRACRSVVSTCTRSLAIADSLRAIDRQTIRAYQQAQPGVARRWGERLLWAGAGYAVGNLTRR